MFPCIKWNPQGSVVGPILFVILINDLPDQFRSTVEIFACDTKIFRALHEPDDYSYLQDDLDRLVELSKLWQLHFNHSKCEVLHIGNSNPSHSYTMSNIPLTKTDEEKDLGVIMDNELKLYKHTAYAVKKVSKMLGLFRATFLCLDRITVPKSCMAIVIIIAVGRMRQRLPSFPVLLYGVSPYISL